MAFTVYENLGGPDNVLEKMRDFAVASGWTILDDCIPDLPINGGATPDGKKLSIKMNDIVAHFRSANGKPIFTTQRENTASFMYGIGMTCSTDYTATPPSGYWYDQPNSVKAKNQEVIGVGIPVKPTANYKLYCNYFEEPAPMLVFSLEYEQGYFQHLAVGEVQKIGGWEGGTIFSGTRASYNMFPTNWSAVSIDLENNHLFGMAAISSTFVRIDIDAAPMRTPAILWANAGPNTGLASSGSTGKILGMSQLNVNTITASWFPKIPHYGFLQSQNATDPGRLVNTLNCISVNMPICLYIQRDPDPLMNFSQIGYVPGIYAISMRNVSSGQLYEISYPQSGILHQVFAHSKRGGSFGYDGISIKQ